MPASRSYDSPKALRNAAIKALVAWNGCTASILGQELWGAANDEAQPSNAARFARQAGKLLNAMLRENLVTVETHNDRSPIWRARTK